MAINGAGMPYAAPSLSVVILTYNESKHIVRALASLAPLKVKAFVVDSFSTDNTVELATASGAHVVQHAFVNQAKQFGWALDTLPIETDWIMRLDADEELTDELAREIAERLPVLPPDVTAVNLKRRHIFLGRWIKHGGRYPLTLLRIWRSGAATIEQRWMDEHMVLLHGNVVTFRHDFMDHNLNDITFLIDKHNGYATREAIDVLQKKYGLGPVDTRISAGDASSEASRKRRIKDRLYYRLPFWLGPLGYFLLRYVIQRGFLDGREGLIYHVLQGFWYRFLVGAKIIEYERSLESVPDAASRVSELERLTGQKIQEETNPVDTRLTRSRIVSPAVVT